MSEDTRATMTPIYSDAESLAEKLRAFAADLTAPEQAILGQLLDRATGDDDTGGYALFAPDLFSSRAIIIIGGAPVAHALQGGGALSFTPVPIPRNLGGGTLGG